MGRNRSIRKDVSPRLALSDAARPESARQAAGQCGLACLAEDVRTFRTQALPAHRTRGEVEHNMPGAFVVSITKLIACVPAISFSHTRASLSTSS